MKPSERPYELFFPLALSGVFALSFPWIPVLPVIQRLLPGVFPAFPRVLHIEAALHLFLVPAVFGFLLTALPRIHGKPPISDRWVIAMFLAQLLGIPAILFELGPQSLVFSLCMLAGVTVYFFVGGTVRPVFSIPIATGLLTGLAGAVWRSIDETGPGTGMIAYGMMPLLIGGAGGMLVVPMSDFPAKPQWKAQLDSKPRWAVWLLSLLFAAASIGGTIVSSWVQAAIAIAGAVLFLHLHQPQWFKSVQSRVFYAGAAFIVAGFCGMAVFPQYRVHMAHLLLAGGLSSSIAAVMVQVALSHGGHVMRPLSGAKYLAVAGILLVLAAVTRLSAALIPAMYLSHLSYAGMAYAAAWIVWLIGFAGRLRAHKSA
jgi:uncharacterized protein involved in response to NO